jgi:hypothetical protein
MPDRNKIKKELEKLIDKFNDFKSKNDIKKCSETNVINAFIKPFFEILGWDSTNPLEYDAEHYIRSTGFADIALKINGESKPIIFIEAKRFGGVPSQNDRMIQTNLSGQKIFADWTEEERQVLIYAGRSANSKCAILTNFQKFRVFNAKTGDTLLNIEKPEEYIDYIDELLLLTKEEVLNGNIDKLIDKGTIKIDIDLELLELVKKWRLSLANSIYQNISHSIETISLYVQRIIDRLIIIRYAEDKWILEPDELKNAHKTYLKSSFFSLNMLLKGLFDGFEGVYNSKIFEKDEIFDEILESVDNKILGEVITELYSRNFRKLSPHILGNTYESYLGLKLVLEGKKLKLEPVDDSKKLNGVYYTHTYVVRYIVENTLGKRLDEFWGKVKEFFDNKEYKKAFLEFNNITKIKVLDPACGSGSFLIEAHDLFIKFYKKYFKEVIKAEEEINKRLLNADSKDFWMLQELKSLIKSPSENYERKILKENIYGVDIDVTAAEIASVNLMLKALKKDEKLPLILYENIKVGNSLITGVDDKDELIEHSNEIKELIALRTLIKEEKSLEKKHILEKKHNLLSERINKELNENLKYYFHNLSIIKPFNWEIEFPEIFYDIDGNFKTNGGFDVVIGNPPYVEHRKLKTFNSFFKDNYKKTYVGTADLYIYFYEMGLHLVKENGFLGFISSNQFIKAIYGTKLKEFLSKHEIHQFIDFSKYHVFDALVSSCILVISKNSQINNEVLVCYVNDGLKDLKEVNNFICENYYKIPSDNLKGESWVLESHNKGELKSKIELKSKKLIDCNNITILRGMTTGYNEAFIIDESIKNELFRIDPKNSKIIKPVIQGRDIKKWKINYKNLYLICTYINFPIDEYYHIGEHLSHFKPELENRAQVIRGDHEWYELDNNPPLQTMHYFEKNKIVWGLTADKWAFTFDDNKYYLPSNGYILTSSDISLKYLLALLNSNLMQFYFSFIGVMTAGGAFTLKHDTISKFPIKEISEKEQEPFIKLVNQILMLNLQKKDIIESFNAILEISEQNKLSKPLKFYLDLKNMSDYGINPVNTKKLIDNNKIGKPKKYKIKKEDSYLILNILYENGLNEDVLKVYFEDSILKDYFYLSIFIVTEGKTKSYRNDKDILDTILNDIKIPQSQKNKKRDAKNIKLVMESLEKEFNRILNDKYVNSPILGFSLDLINHKIREIDDEINRMVYELYGLDNEEIKIIESNLK